MVASGQMVTSDSPGSAVMKWTTLQQAKLKYLKFFSFFSYLFVRNIFREWIELCQRTQAASWNVADLFLSWSTARGILCDLHPVSDLHMVHLHRPPSDLMTSILGIHTFISMQSVLLSREMYSVSVQHVNAPTVYNRIFIRRHILAPK